MAVQTDMVDKVRQYAAEASRFEVRTVHQTSTVGRAQYELKLDEVLGTLRQQVKEQKSAVENLRASQSSPTDLQPSADPQQRLSQIHRIIVAYESLLEHGPSPSPLRASSPLASLVALQQTHAIIRQMKAAISKVKDDIIGSRNSLEREGLALHDARIITQAMGERIESIHVLQHRETDVSPFLRARARIAKQREEKSKLAKENAELETALTAFIDDHLAVMIAAEDLGGPVTGDITDIEGAMLELGFTSQGKARNPRNSKSGRSIQLQKGLGTYFDAGKDISGSRRRETAATGMKSLIERLMNARGSGNIYLESQQDSAAARFLVRAKAAQYHPRDATRLRLIDFASDVGE